MNITGKSSEKFQMFLCDIWPFWIDLTSGDQQEMLRGMSVKTYRQGVNIDIHELYHKDYFWIAGDGSMSIIMYNDDGREKALYKLHKGDMEIAFRPLLNYKGSTYIRANLEKNAELYTMPKPVIEKILFENEEARRFITQANMMFVNQLVEMVGDLSFSHLNDRLIKLLRKDCQESPGGTIVITHEALASELGTSREVISRLLKHLSRQGIVSMKRRQIRLN